MSYKKKKCVAKPTQSPTQPPTQSPTVTTTLPPENPSCFGVTNLNNIQDDYSVLDGKLSAYVAYLYQQNIFPKGFDGPLISLDDYHSKLTGSVSKIVENCDESTVNDIKHSIDGIKDTMYNDIEQKFREGSYIYDHNEKMKAALIEWTDKHGL